ncbi:MAG: hypothetical protein PHR81_10180 [Bacteroidales bacterium]|jgi:hypothetical protein|nr:hypothetical protein [Bacteroidales bacterium]MDD4215168.1 hypothetical protein [Bacteroidales bacterium]
MKKIIILLSLVITPVVFTSCYKECYTCKFGDERDIICEGDYFNRSDFLAYKDSLELAGFECK